MLIVQGILMNIILTLPQVFGGSY